MSELCWICNEHHEVLNEMTDEYKVRRVLVHCTNAWLAVWSAYKDGELQSGWFWSL